MTIERAIELYLYASLQRFLPNAAHHYPIAPRSRIRDLVQRLGIPDKEVKLVFVDGIKADLDTELNGGERVGIFPPVGGG